MSKLIKISQLFCPNLKRSQKKILAVFAHPDDEALQIGGLLAKAATENIHTCLLCLSKGERGFTNFDFPEKQLRKRREKELVAAGKILGLKEIFHFDVSDGKLFYSQEKLKRIIDSIVKKIKPGIIITHDPTGITGHPDHITTSLVVKSLVSNCYLRAINLYFVVLGKKERDFRQKIKGLRSFRFMPPATHCLDVGIYSDVKAKACLAHKSQDLGSLLSIPLQVWFKLFDKECLHLVELPRRYRFKYKPFNSKGVNFSPSFLQCYSV